MDIALSISVSIELLRSIASLPRLGEAVVRREN